MEDIIKKRILLAKEFYLNAVQLAESKSPINKMMAIHNYHIAIEISVKAIMLKFEIRNAKTLNIDFESMLNEVDNFNDFKSKNIKLPYRQEMRNLNQMRNLIQHHAIEPEENSMDDWKLYSNRFLTKIFKTYFEEDFNKINRISFIDNEGLKKYLEAAFSNIQDTNFIEASSHAAAAFEYAAISISEFIPRADSSFFIESKLKRSDSFDKELGEAFQDTLKKIDNSKKFSALLASGVKLSDYKYYTDVSPIVTITANGNPIFQTHNKQEITYETSIWLLEFTVATIIQWQQLGLEPKITDFISEGALRYINEKLN